MKKRNKIIQNHFSVDHPYTIDNFLALTFLEDFEKSSTVLIKFPDSWRFYDKNYPYYFFSQN